MKSKWKNKLKLIFEKKISYFYFLSIPLFFVFWYVGGIFQLISFLFFVIVAVWFIQVVLLPRFTNIFVEIGYRLWQVYLVLLFVAYCFYMSRNILMGSIFLVTVLLGIFISLVFLVLAEFSKLKTKTELFISYILVSFLVISFFTLIYNLIGGFNVDIEFSDSLFYSATVFYNVVFGNIVPTESLAKVFTILEVVCSVGVHVLLIPGVVEKMKKK